ncbi:MAG: thiopurine S-methyltransferase [Pseudomonadota bacterium]
MEHEFWHDRWASNQIAFHEAEPHPFLRKHLDRLSLESGDTVFLPLCGKTLDIDWLLGEGYRVIGCELNEGAVAEVFERLGLEPERAETGSISRWQASALTVFIGDFFELTQPMLGSVDGVFDRGSLVALPLAMRQAYAPHLVTLTPDADHLTVTYDYEQSQTAGPPFSVPFEAVQALFADTHKAERIEARAITGPLAQRCSGEELAIGLTPR